MIYVTGDTHGPTRLSVYGVDGVSSRLNQKSFPEQRGMTENDYVIICGDFGCVWNYDSRYDASRSAFGDVIAGEHGESKEEKYWLDWLAGKPFTVLFCDGNHENFDRLDNAYPEVDFHGGRAHRIRENVYHLMRGYVFELDGVSLFVFGGAESHDIQDGILHPAQFSDLEACNQEYKRWNRLGKRFRIDHISWWERELPSQEEMERGVRNLQAHGNRVDFVISHCAPLQVAAMMGYSEQNRLTGYFDTIAETVEFRKWFFGHYHDNRQFMDKYIMLYEQIIRIH